MQKLPTEKLTYVYGMTTYVATYKGLDNNLGQTQNVPQKCPEPRLIVLQEI